MIGKLERVPLREVWKGEAKDFTPWLRDNIEVLGDALDIVLSGAEKEQGAGDFAVDLVAEDGSGNPVVIENQLEKSDHDHLGKLLTYLTAVEARIAIWIVADPRPEHVKAVAWLNESHAASFYLVKVEAVAISGSTPAPLFTLIVGPSEESRQAGEAKSEIAERYLIRERFWSGLLDVAKKKSHLHGNISPGQYSWIGAGSGRRGITFNYAVRQHNVDVELYIDRGKDAEDENKSIFDQLRKHRVNIEKVFGGSLEWQKLEGKRACRIRKVLAVGGYRDEPKWPKAFEAASNAMCRLEKALKPYIAQLES